MNLQCFRHVQTVPWERPVVWKFFSDPANLAVLTPPEAGFESGEIPTGPVFPGEILTHRVKILPGIKVNWVTEILHVDRENFFVDAQQSGPFRFWRHRHEFVVPPGGEGTTIHDTVHWALPLDPVSRVALPFVRKQLAALFAYRAKRLPEALAEFATGVGKGSTA